MHSGEKKKLSKVCKEVTRRKKKKVNHRQSSSRKQKHAVFMVTNEWK